MSLPSRRLLVGFLLSAAVAAVAGRGAVGAGAVPLAAEPAAALPHRAAPAPAAGVIPLPWPATAGSGALPAVPPPVVPDDPLPPVAAGPQPGVVAGLTMFRGSPQRTFHGTGPVPDDPRVLWRFPDAAMCGSSAVAGESKVWCGTGWTGQPVVWERPDGVTEVIFGAYDKRVHFVDAATGERTRPDLEVGDIVKGSVVLDPDGFPLLYVGSRVDRFMIVALDREVPTEIWSLPSSYVKGRWNNDWDSSALIVDGHLLVGGENSWWFAVELNRSIGPDGLVTLDPVVVSTIPAWSEETLAAVGEQQSIENSTAVFGDTAYFANSAGRVVGVDLERLETGPGAVVFDFWAGDDIDATIVVDAAGMLYVAPQVDLRTPRAAQVGQLLKLDPDAGGDPVVWSLEIPSVGGLAGGAWATPALHAGTLYVATNPGELLAVDAGSGTVVWRDDIGAHAWSSPLVVDDTLVVAVNCNTAPALRAYDLSDPAAPAARWELPVGGGCIESTPAMWAGRLYVGSRDGYFYAIGEAAASGGGRASPEQ